MFSRVVSVPLLGSSNPVGRVAEARLLGRMYMRMPPVLKLFRTGQREERWGDTLEPRSAWSVEPIDDAPPFFRALPDLLPTGSIIYLEDVDSDDGMALARRHSIGPEPDWAAIRPAMNFFHLPLTSVTAGELADFTECHATPEIAMHIHAYVGNQVLLEWHDAFTQPLRLSRTLPEQNVRRFCELLHCNYTPDSA